MIKKRGGNAEAFLKDKLFLSIYRSVDHLDDPIAKASHLTNTVLRRIQKDNILDSATITSTKLSAITNDVLKHYNAASSVRYLSFQTKLQLPGEVRRLFL
jgi:transcriptional regulator NrdR family protein